MFFHEGMGWWMVFGGVWMLLFWVCLVALVVWGIKKLTGRSGSSSKQAPMDIARE